MAAMRSLSFTLSSSAPVTTCFPAGAGRRNEERRELIDREWHELARNLDALQLAPLDLEIGERFARRRGARFTTRIRAPMSLQQSSSSPVRVGLTPTLRMVSTPSCRQAAGHHEERGGREVPGHLERGTDACVAGRSSRMRRPSTRHARAEGCATCARCDRASLAGSVTDVAPSAYRPASSTADLTCALATGKS